MNLLDIIILILLMLGAIRGFQKGLIHELALFAGIIAGIFLAVVVSNMVEAFVEPRFDWNVRLVKVIAFVLVFLGIIAIIRMLGGLLTKLFKVLMLGFINRLAGLAIGVLKWAVLLSVIIMVIDFFDTDNLLLSESFRAGSLLYGYIDLLATWLMTHIDYEYIQEKMFLAFCAHTS